MQTLPPVGAPYYQVNYPASTNAGELQLGVTYTLWIPGGVPTLRGVIVHQHGGGEGACKGGETAAYDFHWQALARKWDCALLGPSYHQAEKDNCALWCDPRNGSDNTFLRALIGFAPDPRTSHECGDSRYLAIPFFDACLAQRLPDKGSASQQLKPMNRAAAWLAPWLGDTPQPAAAFTGSANEAVWLPNEAVAQAWTEYVKTGATTDTTPPPAPTNVRASQDIAVRTDQEKRRNSIHAAWCLG